MLTNSLTLIDALDTLVVLGNCSEFLKRAEWAAKTLSLRIDRNVSVFETNIRVLGGLLSAYYLQVFFCFFFVWFLFCFVLFCFVCLFLVFFLVLFFFFQINK